MGPTHTPVLSPGRDNGHPDDERSLVRDLPFRRPIKRRAGLLEGLVESSGTVSSARSHPNLTSLSRPARKESLPSFHQLVATVERSGTVPSAQSHPALTSPSRIACQESLPSIHQLVESLGTVPSAHSSPDLTSPSRLACQEALPSIHHLVESLGTVPSAQSYPDLTSTSHPACQEAPPLSHQHSTLAATMNIWHRHNDRELTAHFDQSTDDVLDRRLKEHSPLISEVKLQLVIDLAVKRRFEVTIDFTQWKDFARAVRIEQVAPVDEVQHENIFLPDIQAAMEIMYDEVGTLDGNSNDCETVLSAAEEAVDGVFFRRNLYLEMA